ncbi:uncharacterized protein BXZ73DRAFT_80651 [Epithele typhae]|uniref:uncharacterized protein n=1 Tax=Epithele typhae TaxID=378194 RepID=UPI0020089067|nr:uncharacterized protein BXZ73DRAFT_80651 [Epithele typhae]KAH9918185.1 hypothetical protein BXZ73DRAFT_80651 [Epithele typhae]
MDIERTAQIAGPEEQCKVAPAIVRPAHIVLASRPAHISLARSVPQADGGPRGLGAHWRPGVADGRVGETLRSSTPAPAQVRSVAMMQRRSSTCFVSHDKVLDTVWRTRNWVETIGLGEFLSSALPLHLLKRVAVANQQAAWDAERPLHEKLRKADLRLPRVGPEGQGQ